MNAALAVSVSFAALSLLAVGLTVVSAPAVAQDAEPAPAQNTAPGEDVPQLPPVTVESGEQPNAAAAPQPKPAAEISTPPQKAAAKPKRVAKSPPKPAPAPAASVESFEPIEETTAISAGPTTTSTTGQGRGGPSGVDGYQATRSSSATKTDTPLRDVPQSATVVTKELAKDQGSKDLNSALRYVPGIHVQQGEGHRDAITIRGQSTTADFYVDGVRDDAEYFRDIYNVDVIEILKGPNAMIFGRGGGGGVVNRVTKKADFVPIREGAVTFGSFDTKRATVDVGAALTQDFAVRVNGLYENSGGFRDFYELERYGFNPTVTAKLSDQTVVRLGYEYFSDERTVDRGVPSFQGSRSGAALTPQALRANPLAPSRPDRETFFGHPNVSLSDFAGHNATATIEHRTDFGLKLRNHTSYTDVDKVYSNTFANGAVNSVGNVPIAGYIDPTQRETFVNQTDVTYKLDVGDDIRHTIVFGTEFSRQTTDNSRNEPRFGSPTGPTTFSVPFANPTSFAPVFFNRPTRDRQTEVDVASGYIQDQLEITKYFQVIGGLRYDRFDVSFENGFPTATNPASVERTDDVWSPRLGFVIKPFEPLSIYVSTSETFLPGAGDQFNNLTLLNGQSLEPEHFKNNEFGFKWDVLPRLAFSGALYQLQRENTSVTLDASTSLQVGETRTKGGELALTGYVTDQWQIALGYGYQNAIITQGSRTTANNPATDTTGNRVPQAPEHILSFWNRYQVLDWFGVGVGVIHSTDFNPAADNFVEVPGYTRLDAALFMKLDDHWQAQLNVENVLDDSYFVSAHNNNNISYGSPRAFYLTVTNNF